MITFKPEQLSILIKGLIAIFQVIAEVVNNMKEVK